MHRLPLNAMALSSFAVLVAIPGAAQIKADPGPVQIRIAREPPPPARNEARPARPHPASTWISGYWDRRDDRWDWESGRWVMTQPTVPKPRWIKARYTRQGCPWYRQQNCVWRYEPAHWSNQPLVEGEDYQRWKDELRSGNKSAKR